MDPEKKPAVSAVSPRTAAVAQHLLHRCDGPIKDMGLPKPFEMIHDVAREAHALIAQYNKAQASAAAYALGKLYEEFGAPSAMTIPTRSQFIESAFWYRLAADAGHSEAQFALGSLMRTGLPSVGGSPEEAIGWIKKAADQGHSQAEIFLGNAHRYGEVLKKDPVEALACFQRALNRSGSWLARYYLAEMLEMGEGVEPDPMRAVTLYTEAAEQGYKRAQYKLGMMYLEGHIVPKNRQHAISLLSISARQGFKPAKQKLLEIAPATLKFAKREEGGLFRRWRN